MKEESIYIRGCIFAISKLIEKGSVSFAVNIDGEFTVIEWNKIIDYLISQYDKLEKDKEC